VVLKPRFEKGFNASFFFFFLADLSVLEKLKIHGMITQNGQPKKVVLVSGRFFHPFPFPSFALFLICSFPICSFPHLLSKWGKKWGKQ
jgi:hypothetical protein